MKGLPLVRSQTERPIPTKENQADKPIPTKENQADKTVPTSENQADKPIPNEDEYKIETHVLTHDPPDEENKHYNPVYSSSDEEEVTVVMDINM